MIEQYEEKTYKRSRKAYVVECAAEYFINLMITDVFLAKVLTYMRFADSVIGIISSLTAFSFLFQILTVFILSNTQNIKRNVIFCDTLGHFLLMGVYLIPFINIAGQIKTVLVFLCILGAYLIKCPMLSVKFKWANSYVNPINRAEFAGIREIVSLSVGIIYSFVMGNMIDRYEKRETYRMLLS